MLTIYNVDGFVKQIMISKNNEEKKGTCKMESLAEMAAIAAQNPADIAHAYPLLFLSFIFLILDFLQWNRRLRRETEAESTASKSKKSQKSIEREIARDWRCEREGQNLKLVPIILDRFRIILKCFVCFRLILYIVIISQIGPNLLNVIILLSFQIQMRLATFDKFFSLLNCSR